VGGGGAHLGIDSSCPDQRAAVSTYRFSSSQIARCHPARSPVCSLSSQLLTTRSTTFFPRHYARKSLAWLSLQPKDNWFSLRCRVTQAGGPSASSHLPMLLAQRYAAPEAARGSRGTAPALPSLPGAADWRTRFIVLRRPQRQVGLLAVDRTSRQSTRCYSTRGRCPSASPTSRRFARAAERLSATGGAVLDRRAVTARRVLLHHWPTAGACPRGLCPAENAPPASPTAPALIVSGVHRTATFGGRPLRPR
jgi:hypothetical protein